MPPRHPPNRTRATGNADDLHETAIHLQREAELMADLRVTKKRERHLIRDNGWMRRVLLSMDRHLWMGFVEGPWYATGDFDELAFFRQLRQDKRP